MILSNLKFNDVKIGKKVKSLITGNIGIITLTNNDLKYKCMEHEDYHSFMIEINWDNGNKSYQSNCDMNKIEILT